jgi:hypothetical protein
MVGCFGNTLVMTANGTGIGIHVNPTNVTAAVGTFAFNIVDSDLLNEKLEITFAQDANTSLMNMLDIDTGLFGPNEQESAVAFSSLLQLTLTPLFENKAISWDELE